MSKSPSNMSSDSIVLTASNLDYASRPNDSKYSAAKASAA